MTGSMQDLETMSEEQLDVDVEELAARSNFLRPASPRISPVKSKNCEPLLAPNEDLTGVAVASQAGEVAVAPVARAAQTTAAPTDEDHQVKPSMQATGAVKSRSVAFAPQVPLEIAPAPGPPVAAPSATSTAVAPVAPAPAPVAPVTVGAASHSAASGTLPTPGSND
jgi:hypothetical protein